MDNIETNLNSAKNYMERAVTNLVKMKEEHQKTRKVLFVFNFTIFFNDFFYQRECVVSSLLLWCYWQLLLHLSLLNWLISYNFSRKFSKKFNNEKEFVV